MKIIDYLESKGFPSKGTGVEKQANCPFCADTKYHLCINMIKDVFHCVKCGESGNIWSLKQHYGDVSGVRRPPQAAKPPLKQYELGNITGAGLEFLFSRGLTSDTISHFKLKSKDDYIAIPYYENGKIVNIKYRHIKEKRYIREPGGKSTLYNQDNVDTTKNILLVEGEFDCIAAHQIGFTNVVSTSIGATGFKDEWIDFFDKCIGDIYLAYDMDDQGELGAKKIAQRIGSHRCFRVKLPKKDFNECLVEGISKLDIEHAMETAQDYSPDNLIHVSKGMGKLAEYIVSGAEVTGIKVGNMPTLMKYLGGIRESEITVITGETGSGKTTWALNVIYHLINEGERALVVSSEMSVVSICGKLCSMELGEPYYEAAPEKLEEAMRNLGKKYLFFVDVHGALTADSIGEYIKFVKHKYDVKFVLLDHLHYFLRPVDNMVQETEIFMRKMVQLALETKVGVFLIAHPSKLHNDKGIVRMNDIKGASSIKQDSSNVITIWRDRESEEDPLKTAPPVVFKLEKTRFEGGKVGAFKMGFNMASQKYYEVLE